MDPWPGTVTECTADDSQGQYLLLNQMLVKVEIKAIFLKCKIYALTHIGLICATASDFLSFFFFFLALF